MNTQNNILRTEAVIFGKYLLNKIPDENSIALYEKAMHILPIYLNEKEKKILHFIYKNGWTVPLIDAGLTVTNSKSHIRKKIFSMLAILETSPKYSDLFLSKKVSSVYHFYILFILFKSIIKAGIGIVLIAIL